MSIKFSTKEVSEYFLSYGYILNSEYVRIKSPLEIIDSIGYKYYLSLDIFKNTIKAGYRPFIFYKNNIFTLENISLWLKINKKSFSLEKENIFISAESKNLKFTCHKCDKTFVASWNSISNGSSCLECSTKSRGLKRRISLEKIQDAFDNCDVSPVDISQYQGYEKYMTVTCDFCPHIWDAKFGNIKTGYGCPKCRSSKGEKEVAKFLDEYGFKYVKQKTFDGCVYKQKLRFDFFIESENMVIEFNGAQHYHPVDFSHSGDIESAEKEFEVLKKKDKIKKSYCKKNGIKMLTISYKQFNEIDSIIKKINGGN